MSRTSVRILNTKFFVICTFSTMPWQVVLHNLSCNYQTTFTFPSMIAILIHLDLSSSSIKVQHSCKLLCHSHMVKSNRHSSPYAFFSSIECYSRTEVAFHAEFDDCSLLNQSHLHKNDNTADYVIGEKNSTIKSGR